MNKLFFLIVFLFFFSGNSQEKKYFLIQNNIVIIYTSQNNGDFLRTNYSFENNQLKKSSEVYKPYNDNELSEFYSQVIPIDKIRSDSSNTFNDYKNKVFFVENKLTKKKERYVFFGSSMISEEDSPGNLSNDNLIKKNIASSDFISRFYCIQEIEGIHFFVTNQKIFVYKKDVVLNELFPNSKITFSDRNFSNLMMYQLVSVIKNGNSNGDLYGVIDNSGKEILPAKFGKVIICADAILAKDKDNYWYFYDFYGIKIIKKGYRKILPLRTSFSEDLLVLDKKVVNKKGVIRYIVLDGNQLKEIENIYQSTNKSEFISSWQIFSVCGYRPNAYEENYSKVTVINNKAIISNIANLYNHKTAPMLFKDVTMHQNNLSLEFDDVNGKLLFPNEKDSIQYLPFIKNNSSISLLLKRIYNKKEQLLLLNVGDSGKFLSSTIVKFNCHYDEDIFFDKIKFRESHDPMLMNEGEMDCLGMNQQDLLHHNIANTQYFFLNNENKYGYYNPRYCFLENVQIKYLHLDDMKNRFIRFEDTEGKKGWISEDNEEYYDIK